MTHTSQQEASLCKQCAFVFSYIKKDAWLCENRPQLQRLTCSRTYSGKCRLHTCRPSSLQGILGYSSSFHLFSSGSKVRMESLQWPLQHRPPSTMICLSNTATPWPLRPMGMEARMVHSSVSGSYTSVDGHPCDSKEARRITHTPPKTYSFPLWEIILWKQRAQFILDLFSQQLACVPGNSGPRPARVRCASGPPELPPPLPPPPPPASRPGSNTHTCLEVEDEVMPPVMQSFPLRTVPSCPYLLTGYGSTNSQRSSVMSQRSVEQKVSSRVRPATA